MNNPPRPRGAKPCDQPGGDLLATRGHGAVGSVQYRPSAPSAQRHEHFEFRALEMALGSDNPSRNPHSSNLGIVCCFLPALKTPCNFLRGARFEHGVQNFVASDDAGDLSFVVEKYPKECHPRRLRSRVPNQGSSCWVAFFGAFCVGFPK